MDKNSNRILLLTSAFRPFIGGSEIAIEEIAKRLPEFNFDIITPRYTRKLKKEESSANMHIFRTGWGLLSDKLLFPIYGFLKSRQLLKEHEYRFIHAYQASYGAGAAWILKLFYPRLLFLLTLQEGKNLDKQEFWAAFFRKLIIKKADAITVISNYLKNYARRLNHKAKIILIPNGVDIDNFSRDFSYGELSSLADRLSIKPGEREIISVSRLVYKNGIDILIKALGILNHESGTQNYKLILLGDGEQRNELISLAQRLDIFEKITWAGSISHAELPKYLKISDVFVRPSRSEGLGSAFLEAMAAGVPVIGTKVGGIPDFLKDGESGLFCKIADPEDLADKIKAVLTDEKLRKKIIKNSRELVVREYDWNKIAARFSELYNAD